MGCDLCGKEAQLVKCTVEGVIMTVCNNCKQYGEVLQTPRQHTQTQKSGRRQGYRPKQHQEPNVFIVQDYARKIKQAREQKQKKQEELAQNLGIKLSQLHKFESGHQKPSIDMAKKLEKALHISLTEAYQEQEYTAHSSSAGLTIGDLLKKKK